MQFPSLESKWPPYALAILAAVLFIPFLGNAHLFDWDEINFAEVAREMVVTQQYNEPQINFHLFTEKPPLFFWLQAICMNLFGINEMAARLPNAILGVGVLVLIYAIGKWVKDARFGFLWALLFGATILPHLYFKSGIIDPWFNFFITFSLYGIIRAARNRQASLSPICWLLISGCMAGCALLTKGPAAWIVLALTLGVYWIAGKGKWFLSVPQLLLLFITSLLTAGAWFAVEYFQNGSKFLIEFTIRQWELFATPDAGHGGFLLYHVVVLFFGCFPATVFFIRSFGLKTTEEESFAYFRKWMSIFFWVVLVLFSIVRTKIVHYSSLCYFPLTFLATITLYQLIAGQLKINGWMKAGLWITGFPFVLAPIAVTYLGFHPELLKPLLAADPFAVENMEAVVHWSPFTFLPGLFLLIGIVVALWGFRRQKNALAIGALLLGTVLFVQLTLYYILNNVERISQRANIEFWESHAKEDCHMTTYAYKSYTHYFYGQMKPQPGTDYLQQQWLLYGAIDKPVYISSKVNTKAELEEHVKDAIFLYHKNGFYFYKRMPQPK